MAILVTGAAGLIGRAAVAALLRQGVEQVRAVVREPGQAGRLLDLGNGQPLPGSGRQRVAPVWVGDVARAIAAADDAVELRATWSLAEAPARTLGPG